MAKTLLIVHLRVDPPAIAIGTADGKLVFRDIRCMQTAAGGPASKKCTMDSALTSMLANYDSDADSNEDADCGTDDDHDVAAELGVDAAHPGSGDGVGDVEANPMPAYEDVEELDCDDVDGAKEARVDDAGRLSVMASLRVWPALSINCVDAGRVCVLASWRVRLALSINCVVWLVLMRLT